MKYNSLYISRSTDIIAMYPRSRYTGTIPVVAAQPPGERPISPTQGLPEFVFFAKNASFGPILLTVFCTFQPHYVVVVLWLEHLFLELKMREYNIQ